MTGSLLFLPIADRLALELLHILAQSLLFIFYFYSSNAVVGIHVCFAFTVSSTNYFVPIASGAPAAMRRFYVSLFRIVYNRSTLGGRLQYLGFHHVKNKNLKYFSVSHEISFSNHFLSKLFAKKLRILFIFFQFCNQYHQTSSRIC